MAKDKEMLTFKDFIGVPRPEEQTPEYDEDQWLYRMFLKRKRSTGSEGGPLGEENLDDATNKPTLPTFGLPSSKRFHYTVYQVKLNGSLTNKEHLNDWDEVSEWAEKNKNRYSKIKIERSDGKVKFAQHDGSKWVEVKK